MIQYTLLERAPRFLRWYRTRFTIDWKRLASYLPAEGKLLDVGCGVGLVDYAIARTRPRVEILGIDISAESVARAKTHHALPNVGYQCIDLADVDGRFDCILLVDVLHHVPPTERPALLHAASLRLADGGVLLIKDIERRRGQISAFMDCVVSGADEVYLQNCDEWVAELSACLEVVKSGVHFRFPFPHLYIVARKMATP